MFNFIIIHKLQEFVTPLTVFLSSEKAQNPARKHFEKTNHIHALSTTLNTGQACFSLWWSSSEELQHVSTHI